MSPLSDLTRFGGRDMAIDLGTANTVIYVRGAGIVLSEPSVVAIDEGTGQVQAVGSEAQRMIGRTPASISAIRPLRHGVIADFEVTEQMLRYFIQRVHRSRFAHPRVVICAPSGITGVEKRALEEACVSAGARRVHLIEEPMAAAIGAGLPVAEPTASTVVDVGGGTSEVAVISLGGIVSSRSVRLGGYDLDDAVAAHVKSTYNIAIGQPTAEQIKVEAGSAMPQEDDRGAEVRGLDLVSGVPKSVTLTAEEIRSALGDHVDTIVEAVRETLEETPPQLAADVWGRGIVLAGGGSMLRGFEERVGAETHTPTSLVESPLDCVAVGAGRSLEEVEALERGGGASSMATRARLGR
jgi:rod shape-determining protein MreB